MTRRVIMMAIAAWIGVPGALAAHAVPPEPTVEAFIHPQPGQLLVLLRLPTVALVDASLPRLVDGTLNATALEPALRLVAAAVADNLEFRKGDITLARPSIRVAASPLSDRSFTTFASAIEHVRAAPNQPIESFAETEAFVDIEMVYAVPQGLGGDEGFSARLDVFSSPGQPVRTVAHYVAPTGERTVSVRRSTERVSFDPHPGEVVKQFSGRALETLFSGGDYLLLILCLVVPARRAQDVAVLFAAGVIAQIAGAIVAVGTPPAPLSLLVVQMVGASSIVIASLQNIAAARLRWIRVLVVFFGGLYGLVLGDTIAGVSGFAGRHDLLAMLTFLVVLELAVLWIGSVLWLSMRWLNDRGLPDRAVSILFGALVAHTAIHRVMDIGEAFPSGLDHVLVPLTLGWASVMLLVGLVEVLTGGLRRDRSLVADGRTVP